MDDVIEDEANEREIRRIRRRELSKRLPFHCGQLMRYDEIKDGDILDRRQLTGAYYCERCSTMQPTYKDVEQPSSEQEGSGDWCDDCQGYTHMPWCSEYEEPNSESELPIPDSEKLERFVRATGEPTVMQALTWIQRHRASEQPASATGSEIREALVAAATAITNKYRQLHEQNERLREALRQVRGFICETTWNKQIKEPRIKREAERLVVLIDALNHAEQGEEG